METDRIIYCTVLRNPLLPEFGEDIVTDMEWRTTPPFHGEESFHITGVNYQELHNSDPMEVDTINNGSEIFSMEVNLSEITGGNWLITNEELRLSDPMEVDTITDGSRTVSMQIDSCMFLNEPIIIREFTLLTIQDVQYNSMEVDDPPLLFIEVQRLLSLLNISCEMEQPRLMDFEFDHPPEIERRRPALAENEPPYQRRRVESCLWCDLCCVYIPESSFQSHKRYQHGIS